MTNVEYRCPKCGTRHFGPPGGVRFKCPYHDVEVKQVEDYKGPDFGYVDEGAGIHLSKTGHVKTEGAAEVVVTVQEIESVFQTDDLGQLRALYMKMFDEVPDGRRGKRWLKEQIQKELDRQTQPNSEADGDEDDSGPVATYPDSSDEEE